MNYENIVQSWKEFLIDDMTYCTNMEELKGMEHAMWLLENLEKAEKTLQGTSD